MPTRASLWRFYRVLHAIYVLVLAAALPTFPYVVIRFGKKGLLLCLLYAGVESLLRSKLNEWECPRCSQSFLGDAFHWRYLLAKQCCANCGLTEGAQVSHLTRGRY